MAQLKGLVHHVHRAAAMGFPRMRKKASAMAMTICRDKTGIAPAKTPAAKPRDYGLRRSLDADNAQVAVADCPCKFIPNSFHKTTLKVCGFELKNPISQPISLRQCHGECRPPVTILHFNGTTMQFYDSFCDRQAQS